MRGRASSPHPGTSSCPPVSLLHTACTPARYCRSSLSLPAPVAYPRAGPLSPGCVLPRPLLATGPSSPASCFSSPHLVHSLASHHTIRRFRRCLFNVAARIIRSCTPLGAHGETVRPPQYSESRRYRLPSGQERSHHSWLLYAAPADAGPATRAGQPNTPYTTRTACNGAGLLDTPTSISWPAPFITGILGQHRCGIVLELSQRKSNAALREAIQWGLTLH